MISCPLSGNKALNASRLLRKRLEGKPLLSNNRMSLISTFALQMPLKRTSLYYTRCVTSLSQHSVVSACQKRLHRTLNRVPNDQELMDALVAEEHPIYQAYTAANKNQGNRRRGPSPSRQQARPWSRSRSPAQRQNPKHNNRSAKRQFQNRSNRSSGNSQINCLAAQVDKLQQQISQK